MGQPLMIICTSSFMCFPMPSQEGGVNIHAVTWYIVVLSYSHSVYPVTILAQDSVLTVCAYAAGVLKSALCLLACCFALSWGLASS